MELKPKIMGGIFGLEISIASQSFNSDVLPCFLYGRHRLLATARAAFALLHSFLAPRRVWLPSYFCGIILPAFDEPKTDIRFYAINEQLRIIEDAWLSEVQRGDMVIFIDYFGFKIWDEWGREVRARGAWVVEDACQALLSEKFSSHAHYVLLSPRKFVGVPDGGVLLAQGEVELPSDYLPPVPAEWWMDALTASIMRAEFDRSASDEERSWFKLFQKVEASGPVVPSGMSKLSSFILKYGINWREVAMRRRENYGRLAGAFGEFALFQELPYGVVPLGFPMRITNRDEVRSVLFTHQIYPSIHWPVKGVVPESFACSHQLAGQILTIPCDQRYGSDSIDQIITVLRKLALRPPPS